MMPRKQEICKRLAFAKVYMKLFRETMGVYKEYISCYNANADGGSPMSVPVSGTDEEETSDYDLAASDAHSAIS